jgi:hypothetical protein
MRGETYTNICNEKDVCNAPRQKPTICRKIVYLISELRHDSQCILKERHNNQKPANSGYISATISKGAKKGGGVGYGFTQLMLFSKKSSNLPVYCLIWSSGDEYVGEDAFGGWMWVLYGWFMLGNCCAFCGLNIFAGGPRGTMQMGMGGGRRAKPTLLRGEGPGSRWRGRGSWDPSLVRERKRLAMKNARW